MIVVPFTLGAATPSQIALAAQDRGHPTTFVVDRSDQDAVTARRALEAFGPVVEVGSGGQGALDEAVSGIAALGAAPPAAVATFAEPTLPLAAALAAHHGLPGLDPATIGRMVDKSVQRQRLNACGVGQVESVVVVGGQQVADLPAELPLPGVLKPVAGAGSRDTVFVQTPQDVADGLRDVPAGQRFVVEERIEGSPAPIDPWLADYLSVESAVSAGRVRHLGCTGRLELIPPARERGIVFPVRPPEPLQTAVLDLATRAITALGIDVGLVHTEIKLGPQPQVIEVNARLGGGLAAVMPSAGALDPIGLALDLALGADLPDPVQLRGVTAQLYTHPPHEARSLRTPADLPALRRLDGVLSVDRLARAGDAVDWRLGSASRVLDVCVRADSLEELRVRAEAVEAVVATTLEWSTR